MEMNLAFAVGAGGDGDEASAKAWSSCGSADLLLRSSVCAAATAAAAAGGRNEESGLGMPVSRRRPPRPCTSLGATADGDE